MKDQIKEDLGVRVKQKDGDVLKVPAEYFSFSCRISVLVGSGLGCLWAAFVAPPPSFILSPESSGWGERNGESCVSPLGCSSDRRCSMVHGIGRGGGPGGSRVEIPVTHGMVHPSQEGSINLRFAP